MLVSDLMSTDVVTVPVDATLDQVAEELLGNGVGSTIVVSPEGNPVGMVTESDVLEAARETGRPLADIGVSAVTERPVVTTKPSVSVPTVARTMAAEDVKKVPVMDDVELVGIVTLTDIVWEFTSLRREATELAAAREKWSPE
ncbi:CBS domain-containing protein [Haloarcula salina]|uniref:CBS domain-containing protein n=1 Tax=Haloarcula salina TaxID=1429914 RepID=A0AA41G0I3_9EURY|nr:CBS domain-containing protein [Haloarcula salina]MBV0901113.1 CBS domain-containing protein [Haloarcula salina]